MQSRNKRNVVLAFMVAISLVLRASENLLPIAAFVSPGMKLGLANIVTLIMIYKFSIIEVLVVMFVRIILGSLFAGGISSLAYSVVGGILSLIVMKIASNFKVFKLSILGVSVLGAIAFNIGQLLVASIVVESFLIFAYLPLIGFTSIFSGALIGAISKSLIENKNIWKYIE